MSCEAMAERIPDLLSGALGEAEAAELRAHLAGCAGCAAEVAALERLWRGLGELPEEEPSPELRRRFAARLARAIAAEERRVVPLARPARLGAGLGRAAVSGPFAAIAAAIALVVAGALIGAQLSARRDAAEMAKLRAEVRSLHETVALALLAEASAAKRLEGVAYSRAASAHEQKIADALLDALANDPNVNVRLAALDALRPRAARAEERPRLIAAGLAQDSPLVQLSLVALLLEADGEAVRRDLEQLVENPDLDPVVRGVIRDRLGRRI
jgi:hypothetical protein